MSWSLEVGDMQILPIYLFIYSFIYLWPWMHFSTVLFAHKAFTLTLVLGGTMASFFIFVAIFMKSSPLEFDVLHDHRNHRIPKAGGCLKEREQCRDSYWTGEGV